MLCAAIGTILVLLSLGGFDDSFGAFTLIGAAVAFAAAAIFLIVSIVLRHRARHYRITYQPLSSADQSPEP